jgi:putative holliday junction resolvase
VKILGVDWGRSRSGVAVSDELGLLAHPLTVLQTVSLEELAEELARLARDHRADEIVLGLPRSMDGREGDSAAVVRRLAGMVGERGISVSFWDERLTSWEAGKRLNAGAASRGGRSGRSGRRREKGRTDMAAACLILQGYLDAKKRETPPCD